MSKNGLTNEIGARLRSLRGALSRTAFAEKFGVPPTSFGRWETGANQPDLDFLIRLSGHYKVTLSWLITGEEQNPNSDFSEQQLVHTQKTPTVGGFDAANNSQETEITDSEKRKTSDVGGFDAPATSQSDQLFPYMEQLLESQRELIAVQRQMVALKDEVAALRQENQRLRLTREYPTHLAEPPRPYAGPSAPVAAKAPGVKYEMDHPMPLNIALQDNDEPYKPGK